MEFHQTKYTESIENMFLTLYQVLGHLQGVVGVGDGEIIHSKVGNRQKIGTSPWD